MVTAAPPARGPASTRPGHKSRSTRRSVKRTDRGAFSPGNGRRFELVEPTQIQPHASIALGTEHERAAIRCERHRRSAGPPSPSDASNGNAVKSRSAGATPMSTRLTGRSAGCAGQCPGDEYRRRRQDRGHGYRERSPCAGTCRCRRSVIRSRSRQVGSASSISSRALRYRAAERFDPSRGSGAAAVGETLACWSATRSSPDPS